MDKISFGRTCIRFFNLVSSKEIVYLNEEFKFFFEDPKSIVNYIKYVCGRFELQFYHHYHLKCDRLYLAYFLYILKEKLTNRLICGHLFWCHRKNVFNSECKICCQVFRSDDDPTKTFLYSKSYIDLWDTHGEKVFVEETYLEENMQAYSRCAYFENVYTRYQLITLFGVIAVRLFLNIGKRYLFWGKFIRNKQLYRTYAKYSNDLFDIVCKNIKDDYAGVTIYNLKPYIDYDSKYLKIYTIFITIFIYTIYHYIKISNLHYIDYLEKNVYENFFNRIGQGFEKRSF